MEEVCRLTLSVKVAWWLRPYAWVLCWFATLTDSEPDWDKFRAVVSRAVTVSVDKAAPMKLEA